MAGEAGAAPVVPAGAPGADGKPSAVPPQRRTPEVTHKGVPGATGNANGTPQSPDAKAAGSPGAHSQGTPPPAAKPPKPQPAAQNPDWWKKLDLKIGDATETLEFDTPDQLVDRLRRSEASNKSWQQKNTQIEAAARRLAEMGKDPAAAMRALNPDFDPQAWAIEQARAAYEAEQAKAADPHKWELEQRDARIKEFEAKEQAAAKKQADEADNAQRELNRKRWQERIIEAIDEIAVNENGEPEDADYKATVLLPAVAGVIYQARKLNPTHLPTGQANPNYDPSLDLTPREVAQAVRQQHARTFDRGLGKAPLAKVLPQALKHLSAADDAGVLKHLGPELVARIVKAHLESTNPYSRPTPVPTGGDERQPHDPGRVSAVGERNKIPRL